MAVDELPVKVESLDDLPEEVRGLYQEGDDGYRLPVKGVKTEEEVSGLESALRKLKEERNQYRDQAKRVSDEDLQELKRLRDEARQREEKKAKEEGRWEELREKLQKEHREQLEAERRERESRDKVIEHLTVTSELRSAIAEAGIEPMYHEAVEALLERRGPQVKWEDGKPKGVFPDEVHGPKPIKDYVAEWADSKEAEPYLPPDKGGGGAGGEPDRGEGPTKKVSEMSDDEKADLIDELQEKYGEDWQREWYKLVSAK